MPKPSNLTKEEKARIDAYKDQGLSGRNIGTKIGRHHSVVNKYLRKIGNNGKNRRPRMAKAEKSSKSKVNSIRKQARQLNKAVKSHVKHEDPLQITDDDDAMTENELEIDVNHIERPSVVKMTITSNAENVVKVDKKVCIKPTTEEILNAFDIVTQWAEEQAGDVSVEQLLMLQKLQCLAARQALLLILKK